MTIINCSKRCSEEHVAKIVPEKIFIDSWEATTIIDYNCYLMSVRFSNLQLLYLLEIVVHEHLRPEMFMNM